VCAAGYSEETRHRKVQLAITSILVGPVGLQWGGLCERGSVLQGGKSTKLAISGMQSGG